MAAVLILPAAKHVSGASETASKDFPPAWPVSRYEKMMARSPFALATAVAPPAAPGFAANLYVTGLAKLDSRDFVSISSRDLQTKFSLLSGETSADGITVISVQWSDDVGKSKVTVRKGSETAVIGFDEMAMKNPGPGGPAPQQPPQFPQRPAVIPQIPRPVQQTFTQPQTTPYIAQPPGGQTQDSRRRIRIINSKP